MDTENNKEQEEQEVKDQQEQSTDAKETSSSEEEITENHEESEADRLKKELDEQKDKYLRLYSEFENFRRRTAKEKLELVSTANEDLIVTLLPVIDDFERAKKSLEESNDIKALKEGFDLIHDKLVKLLLQKGLKPIEAIGKEFDAELHEGISQMPVEKKKDKGKVIDEVEKGYYLGEKVIRYSKVVIGA